MINDGLVLCVLIVVLGECELVLKAIEEIKDLINGTLVGGHGQLGEGNDGWAVEVLLLAVHRNEHGGRKRLETLLKEGDVLS